MQNLKQHKGSFTIYILLLIIAVAIMFMLKTCSYKNIKSNIDTASGGDTIDVAIEYSPLALYSDGDTLCGFNFEFMQSIAKRNKLNVKYHPIVSLSDALEKLATGIYDIIIAELPMTAKYKDDFMFTEPVYLDRQVLVQRIDSATKEKPVKSQLDLAGDTVWVVANSPLAQRISNLSREIGDTIYVMEDVEYAAEQLFLMTTTGDIKQAVINERTAQKLAADYPFIDINTNISFTQFQSWLINKMDSALCDSLNNWIKIEKTSQEYIQMQNRYLK